MYHNRKYAHKSKKLMAVYSGVGLLVMTSLCGCRANPSIGISPSTMILTPTGTLSPTYTLSPTDTLESAIGYRTKTPIFIFTRNPSDATPIADSNATARWLKGIPCEPPCWEGVTPGKTTAIEAARIWSTDPLFKEVSVGEWGADHILFTLNTLSGLTQGDVPLFLSNPPDDPNAPISLIHIYAFDNVKLGDLIQAFGPPSHVLVDITTDFHNERIWVLNIIWMSKGFSISHFNILPPPEINQNLTLNQGTYFTPGLDSFRSTDMVRDINGSYFPLYPWHGYDSFNGYFTESTSTP